MGLFGGKKTTTTTNSTSTMTPTNPSWLPGQVQGLAGQVSNLAGQDPYSFVAGADPLQTQGAQGASTLGQDPHSYGIARGTMANLAQSGANTYDPSLVGSTATVKGNSILPNLQAYMSPYTNDVVNTTLANYDRSAGANRAQQMLSIGGMDDTFGGSGAMSYLGNFDASNQLNRAQTEGGLRDQGFQVGAGLANDDANRRQQAQLANMAAFNHTNEFNANNLNAAGQYNATANDTAFNRQGNAAQGLVGIDQTGNADARANYGAQTDIGSVLHGIAQNRAGAPLSVLNGLAGTYGSLPLGLLHGETTTGNSTGTSKTSGGFGSMLGSLGSLAMGLGSSGLGSLFGGQMLTGAGNSLGGLAGIGSGLNLTPFNPITAQA